MPNLRHTEVAALAERRGRDGPILGQLGLPVIPPKGHCHSTNFPQALTTKSRRELEISSWQEELDAAALVNNDRREWKYTNKGP